MNARGMRLLVAAAILAALVCVSGAVRAARWAVVAGHEEEVKALFGDVWGGFLKTIAPATAEPEALTAGFGQPVRVAKLGVKEIFYYKDMKVTFTNGKVSNVE